MSRDDEIQRQLGRGMPTPARDMATERYSIKHTSNVPEEPKKLKFIVTMGIIMVEEDGVYRLATAEEIEELAGGVSCIVIGECVG